MALVNIVLFTVVVIGSILDGTTVNGRVILPLGNTVKGQNGDIYDCVDFYKQPAFQHPLLRNHSFSPMMEPSFTPKRINADGEAKTKNTNDLFLGLKDGGCPFGTVPIRRVAKEQRHRAPKLSRELVNSSFTPNDFPPETGIRWAIVQSRQGSPNYYGVGAKLGILNPKLNGGQYSSAQCAIQNGLDYIQFGWTVNPTIYNDLQTRMFIRTEAGTTHCYNTDCAGFVVVRTDLPLDAVLPEYTSPQKLVTLDMTVFRDPQSGNWWLTIGKDDIIRVGFWPGNILSNLGNFGTYIECGGEAFSQLQDTPDQDPELGTGNHPTGNVLSDAYVLNFVTINDKFQKVDAQDTQLFTNSDYYGVRELEGKQKRDDWGHAFTYGGPRF